MSDHPDPSDLNGRLEAIRSELDACNPQLYRHLALYLQVLRGALPAAVQQATFHLATRVHPERYARLPGPARRQLHGRMALLVQRCSSLLTVEQLACLAARLVEERSHQGGRDSSPAAALEQDEAPEDDPGSLPLGVDNQPAVPPGSIRIDSSPPFSGGLLGWEEGSELQLDSPGAPLPEFPLAAGPWPSLPERSAASAPPGFLMDAAQADGLPADSSSALERGEQEDPTDPAQIGDPGLLWLQGRLPREPGPLLLWLDGMELALARRLRNLSHALNVELLRVGLNPTLLPAALLDAVLGGQLEVQSAPANLLRLPIPLPLSERTAALESHALLVRCTDLEMEDPRLRTCRRRLQQHRQEVRRMARDFRRLHRRLQVHQAERLWLQDIHNPVPPGH